MKMIVEKMDNIEFAEVIRRQPLYQVYTNVVDGNKVDSTLIGTIELHPDINEYCFRPNNLVYTSLTLTKIAKFLDKLNKEKIG